MTPVYIMGMVSSILPVCLAFWIIISVFKFFGLFAMDSESLKLILTGGLFIITVPLALFLCRIWAKLLTALNLLSREQSKTYPFHRP